MDTENQKKHGVGAFMLAGVSFIPLIGIFTGIICIILAVVGRKSNSKLLGGLGFAGIMVSVVLYGTLFYQMFHSDEFTQNFEGHAINTMTSLVRDIEYYKLQQGAYPVSLDALRESYKEEEMLMSYDFSGPMSMGGPQRDFYYKVTNDGENYLLFGIGQDATPFTQDDLYPAIDPKKDRKIGWVKTVQ